ncbi:MAG: hypothetical protein KKE69_00190, partial [Alphaproteobacteria bacterium]|nr:hypothetical protein [Alphaproteobacteria bacterium]MBU1607093.1 hypothetical protein [Alphaproteobacteria bacterium]
MAAELKFEQADWEGNYQALLNDLNQLYRWNHGQPLGTPVVVTFRFADSYPAYRDDLPDPETNFRAFTEEHRAIAVDVMRELEQVINVRFVEDLTSSEEQVDLMISGTIFAGGSGNFPYPDWPFAGDIAIGIGPADGSRLSVSGYDVVGDKSYAGFREIFIHELGHSMGLWHPRNYTSPDGNFDGSSDGYTVAIDLGMENNLYTVMSYFAPQDVGFHNQWVRTLMPLDIMALQYLYGVNQTATAGDDVHSYS